jgi:hypothetical protein
MDNALVGYFKVGENIPKNRGRNFPSLVYRVQHNKYSMQMY